MTNDQNYHEIWQSHSYINEIELKVKLNVSLVHSFGNSIAVIELVTIGAQVHPFAEKEGGVWMGRNTILGR